MSKEKYNLLDDKDDHIEALEFGRAKVRPPISVF